MTNSAVAATMNKQGPPESKASYHNGTLRSVSMMVLAVTAIVIALQWRAVSELWGFQFSEIRSDPLSSVKPVTINDTLELRRPIDIHLFWTTNSSTFRLRNKKVIETYLFHHPNANLHVYLKDLNIITDHDLILYVKLGYKLNFVEITDDYLRSLVNTGDVQCKEGSDWIQRIDEWKDGPYFYSHLTDFMRFCILYKNGGIYSDFDALLLQRMDVLMGDSGFIGKDSSRANGNCEWCLAGGDYYLAPGVMGVPHKKSQIMKQALKIGFGDASTYNKSIFNAVGPKAITLAYKKLKEKSINVGSYGEGIIKVLDTHTLYPYNYLDSPVLFKSQQNALSSLRMLERKSVSLHFYGHQTRLLQEEQGSLVSAVYENMGVTASQGADCFRLIAPNYLKMDMNERMLGNIRVLINSQSSCSIPKTFSINLETAKGSIRILNGKGTSQKLSFTQNSLQSLNEYFTKLVCIPPESDGTDQISISIQIDETIELSTNITMIDANKISTIMIKTFGRMDKVFSLIRSIRSYYKTVRIMVADDGEFAHSQKPLTSDFEYYALPFDVGLSAGRNFMLNRVKSEYFVTLDDDFIFNENSVLEGLLYALIKDGFDIAAAKNPADEQKFELDFCGIMRVDEDERILYLEGGSYNTPSQANCQHVDFVPNIFAGKTSLKIRWDESLKLGEHEDYFLRAKNEKIRVATCPEIAFYHEQVPHWLRKTKYDQFRNRVFQFLKDSLRKHDLVRLVSFGRVMMDLIKPAPLKCLYVEELLDYSLSLEYYDCVESASYPNTHYNFMIGISTNGKEFTTVNAGEGNDFNQRKIIIRDVLPNTKYHLMVKVGNRFEFEDVGRSVTLKTLKSKQARGLVLNSGFEEGHHTWTSSFGLNFHILQTNMSHTGNYSARLTIDTSGYLAPNPTRSRLYQTINIPKNKPVTKIVVAAWSRIERFYGNYVEWRLGAEAVFGNGKIVKYEDDFDRQSTGWQVRSFTLCFKEIPDNITIYGELVTHRGSVLFDDFSVIAS